MVETVLQGPRFGFSWNRRGVEEPGDSHEHLCLCDHSRDVLGAYHRVVGLCDGFSSRLELYRLRALLCHWCSSFWYGSGSDRVVPATLHDETLQVFHSPGALQYDRYVDVAGVDGLGLFLLQ